MTLPKTVKVGPVVYDVKPDKGFGGVDSLWGLVQYSIAVIKVDTNDRDDISMWSTLLHEVIHAIDGVYMCIGEDKIDEATVERLTTGWFQVLRENRLYLEEVSPIKLPKSVKICGIKYGIVCSHNYDIFGDHGKHILGVSDHNKDGLKMQHVIIKHTLVNLITQAICANLSLLDVIDECAVHRLSWGLLDVFIENDFPEKIRGLG